MNTQRWIIALVASATLLGTTTLPADTIYWDGGAGGTGVSWNDAVNWGGDIKPGSSDTAAFDFANDSPSKTFVLGAPQVIRRLMIPDWRGGTMFFGNAADVATGNTLTLSQVFRGSNGANVQTFTANIVLAADSVWDIHNGYNGSIEANGVISGAGKGLAKWGHGNDSSVNPGGTLTLRGANTYTGDTAVNMGTLNLDFNTGYGPAADIIASSSPLKLNGGTLSMAAKSGASRSQTFDSLTIGLGASSTAIASISGANARMTFGTIGRTTGGTLNLGQPTGNTAVNANNGYTTGAANDATGILGTYLTVAGTDWAVNSGVNIVAYAGYADLAGANPPIVDGASSNVRVTNGSTGDIGQAAATVTVNSLAFTDAAARTVTIGSGNTLRLGAVGGILTKTGTGVLNIGAPGSAGTLTAGGADNTAGEIVCVNATTITNNATIADNGSGAVTLTKSGGGTLVLPGIQTYTGGTFVNGGTVLLSAGVNRLATTGPVTVSGGTLNLGTSTNNLSGSVVVRGVVTNGWIVKSGSDYDVRAGAVSARLGGAVGLVKTTPGRAYFVGANTYSGNTTVLEGQAIFNGNVIVKGNLVVGSMDGLLPASVSCVSTPLTVSKPWTVYPNGSLNVGSTAQHLEAKLTLIGGSFTGGQPYFDVNSSVEMTGGSLGGTIYGGGNFGITSLATSTSARVTASIGNSHTFTVADGAAPLDLIFSGQHRNDSKTLTKAGPGVMAVTSTSSVGTGSFNVNAGTLLANNASGSANGNRAASVAAGATLGGIGILGGVSGFTAANVTVTGAPGNLAVLAPGSIHATTGDHIVGTLTVGSATRSNNVTFGDHSKLRVTLGTAGVGDRLTVNGTLSLATANDTIEIVVPEGAKAGTYILASATGGITGTFNNVTKPSSGLSPIVYTANTVELTVLSSGTTIIVR